jgi:hypothetical protein
MRTALADPSVSHVLIPRRDRFARTDDPIDALKLENLLGAVGELFRRLNARLFLKFREVRPKKRKINRVAGGVVTFGVKSLPVRIILRARRAAEP